MNKPFVPSAVEGCSETCLDIARHERADDALALYVHWPFCVSKCPYCDFNSHVRSSIDQDEWRKRCLQTFGTKRGFCPAGR